MKLNRACIADPSHSPPLLSERLLACLSIQLRTLPCSVPSIAIRNTPNLRVLAPPVPSFPDRTFRRLPYLIDPIRDFPNPTMTRPNSPCLPDLNSPCINLLLAVLTHLACWASRNPDVTHPSMPATTNPARPKRSPSICIRHSVPATPCLSVLSRPVLFIRCLA